MSEGKTFTQRWEEFRPSKSLWLWSCVGCVAATVFLGFTAGGWVTGGTADGMARGAAEEARAEVVAALCVNRFVAAADASTRLAELKDASSWDRDNLIEDAGWTTIKGLDEDVSEAADLCAEQLVAMDEIPAKTLEPVAAPADETPIGG